MKPHTDFLNHWSKGASDGKASQVYTLGLQIAQSRPYLHTLGLKVGMIYIHGALGIEGL